MTGVPFTKELRADMLRRAATAQQDYLRIKDEEFANHPNDPDWNRMDAAGAARDLAKQEYLDGLHRVQMSACPFCQQGFEYSFDPFDTDGPWWRGIQGPEIPACPHYCFVRGAVNFSGGPLPTPPRSEDAARCGPEVPYVIPKQLELPNVVAVIGELEMDPGWRAFPIVYFADPRPAAELLSFNWGQSMYSYMRSNGQPETGYPNDPWDFELEPWIARGKLLWCVRGSKNRRLANPKGPCPYVGLQGTREMMKVEAGVGLVARGTPDGTMILPFE